MVRAAMALSFLLMSLLVSGAGNSSKTFEQVQLFGSSYVRLSEWCESTGFSMRWVKKDEELQVTNKICRFSFAVDSRKVQVNGMGFMLSLPIVVRNGAAFISSVDLDTAITPILWPARNAPGVRVKTICLDAGHGGKDPGNMEKRIQEKKYTLLLTLEVARLLKQAGFDVILTRGRDKFVELSDRANIANRSHADLFLSLHFNAAANPDVKGAEVYCMAPPGTSSSNGGGGKNDTGSFAGNANNDKNLLLALQMEKALLKSLGVEDRGVKRARFEVLRQATMPAVLVETAFMSNPQELKRVMDSEYRKSMAHAIVDGVNGYKRIVER